MMCRLVKLYHQTVGPWPTANQWQLPPRASKPCSYLKQC